MKILIIFTFFVFVANYAQAQNIVERLNNDPQIKRDVEAKIYYPHEKKRYPYKGFAYCNVNNRTLECKGENIFCVIIPWHKGDYQLKYEVAGCNWIKLPEEKQRKIEKELKMQETHIKVISGSLDNPKVKWVPKKEYY